MQDVPKIVEARLQRAGHASAEIHPDADLLTAFAEQSLGESERGQVMEHLARCGDCRDVVALALPAIEDAAVPLASPDARGASLTPAWLSWPVLRWGVVAAGLALVTSVGVLQYKQRASENVALVTMPPRQQEKTNASQRSPAPDQSPAEQGIGRRDQEIAKVPARRHTRAQSEKTADQQSRSLNALFSAPQPTNASKQAAGIGSGWGGGIGSGVSRPVGVGSGSGMAPTQNPNAQLPGAPAGQVLVPGTSSAVEVQAESAQIVGQDPAEQQLAQNQVELPSQKQRLNNLDVVKAKDSVGPPAESKLAPAAAIPDLSLQNGLRAFPRWAITSSGALQRSFDAGRTWEDVTPSQTSLADGAQMENTTQLKTQYGGKQSSDKKIRKKDQANPPVVFRAVAAFGPEVWAGGSSAMLYHSLDSGSHWRQVVPRDANAWPTGDIVGVEFSDTQHGKISTSAGEVWMTGDDGETWRKQQ